MVESGAGAEVVVSEDVLARFVGKYVDLVTPVSLARLFVESTREQDQTTFQIIFDIHLNQFSSLEGRLPTEEEQLEIARNTSNLIVELGYVPEHAHWNEESLL